MDNSLTLARHFARLRLKEGRLAVNMLVMPQALTGVQELAEQMVVYTISEIEIDEKAKPAELLARALQSSRSSAA